MHLNAINDIKTICKKYKIEFDENLSDEFIEKFKANINWIYVSEEQIISEEFIKEFQDKVNWDYISINQKLSENFVREFKWHINWNNLPKENYSKEFLEEMKDVIEFKKIMDF